MRASRRRGAGKPTDQVPNPTPSPLSEDERREVVAFDDRTRNRQRSPCLKVQSAPGKPINISHHSRIDLIRLMAAFGTAEMPFADWMVSGLLNAACDGNPRNPPSEQDVNRALAAVTGVGARDEVEGMLATQMVATHFAAMTLLRRLKSVDNIPQQDSAGNLAVKLLRTYTAQVEALQRYRGKGQQKVTVEHVHVHQGGQAIVGAVTQGGGASSKIEDQPHAPPGAITYEPGQTLPGEIEAVGEAVPSACS